MPSGLRNNRLNRLTMQILTENDMKLVKFDKVACFSPIFFKIDYICI